MDNREFQAYKRQFVSALRQVLLEQGNDPQTSEAAFPVYSDSNPLIRFLFWRCLCATVEFAGQAHPYQRQWIKSPLRKYF